MHERLLSSSSPQPASLTQGKDVESAGWFLTDPPTRQSTADSKATTVSTAASDGDIRSVNYPKLQPAEKRLDKVPELRGWKYFFTQTLRVPLSVFTGIVIGILVTAAATKLTEQPKIVAPYEVPLPPQQVPASYLASKPLDNSCLIPNLSVPAGPQTFDACDFVIRSTDETWNLRGDVDKAIDKYFYDDYLDAGSWGRRIIGKKALRDAILSEMRAFPDIQIHITDCACVGDDNRGYKCMMADVLTGTNTGPSGYGPATGRFARWTGLIESLVQQNPETGQWQYTAEWGVHDEWSLIQQLGLDFARVPRPPTNTEPLHDCNPLVRFKSAAQIMDSDSRLMAQHKLRDA